MSKIFLQKHLPTGYTCNISISSTFTPRLFAIMNCINEITNRICSSFHETHAFWKYRNDHGIETIPQFTDYRFTTFQFVFLANIVYGTVSFYLWHWSKRGKVLPFLSKIIAGYNILCVMGSMIVVLGYIKHWDESGLPLFAGNKTDYDELTNNLQIIGYIFYSQKYLEWGKLSISTESS